MQITIKQIDATLWRQVKAQAAKEGITIRVWVTLALWEALRCKS